MILLLAKSELFTENVLVPITAVIAGEAGVPQLLKLCWPASSCSTRSPAAV